MCITLSRCSTVSCLCGLCRGHKSVVFVLDEFDLFAKPVKQTVLYNLLDALQVSNIQVSAQRSRATSFRLGKVTCQTQHRADLQRLLSTAQQTAI